MSVQHILDRAVPLAAPAGRSAIRWQLPRYKQQWQHICALLPVYLPDGTNGCRIVYDDGSTEQVAARLSWVMDDLLGYRRSSRAILQQQSRQILEQTEPQGRRIRLPLVLSGDFCLVPVRIRRPFSRRHAADGYVVLSQVQGLSDAAWHASAAGTEQQDTIKSSMKEQYTINHGTELVLTGDSCITVLDRRRTVRENLNLAAALAQAVEQCL